MSDVVEYSYNNRNNTIDLLLKSDGTAQDLSAVSRMILKDVGGSWTVDHNVAPGDVAFDWSPTPAVTGKVIIALGAQSITAGKYRCRLVVYDPTNTSGIAWGNDPLIIHVV